jgi:hypothetical protein
MLKFLNLLFDYSADMLYAVNWIWVGDCWKLSTSVCIAYFHLVKNVPSLEINIIPRILKDYGRKGNNSEQYPVTKQGRGYRVTSRLNLDDNI